MKLCLALLCVVALILAPLPMVTAFELNVGLYDAKIDSGKVKVSVSSQATNKEKSRILDVGKITSKSGDSKIENIIFKFSEKELPCERADRHYNARSAGIWIQVPSSNRN